MLLQSGVAGLCTVLYGGFSGVAVSIEPDPFLEGSLQ